MMCGGCEKAVTAMLKKVDGVTDVKAMHESNRVEVQGTADSATMLAAIKKTGKACHLLE